MIPYLEIRHLSMLIAVAEAPSMAVAAELLGLTQSALSHRLREAERRLGTALFRRERKRLVLTPAGERLLLSARRIVEGLARTESDIEQIAASGVTSVARLGQAIYAGLPWFAPFHAWAAERLPDLQIEVAADACEEPLQLLAESALDVALVAGGVSRPGVVRRRLFTDALVAVAPPGHAWAGQPFVTPLDLSREVFLAYGFVVQPGFENERFMRPANLFPRRVIKVGRPEAILELVAAGRGVTVLAAWAVRRWVEQGRVIARPLGEGGLPLDWFAATRESDTEEMPGPRLAAALRDWCGESGGFSTPPAPRSSSPPARPRRARRD